MKCCLCGEPKKEFLLNTDLCVDCSQGLTSKRTEEEDNKIIGTNFEIGILQDKYPAGNYYLYKWLGSEGDILYIGKSRNIISRLASHIRNSDFNFLIKSLELTELPSQVDMDIAELIEINRTKTRFNKQISYGECSFESNCIWFEPEDIIEKIRDVNFI